MAGTLIAAGIVEGIDPLAGVLVATLSGCVPMQAIGWVLSKGTPPPQELLLVMFEHELSGFVIPPDPLSVRWGQVRETHRVLLRAQGARGMRAIGENTRNFPNAGLGGAIQGCSCEEAPGELGLQRPLEGRVRQVMGWVDHVVHCRGVPSTKLKSLAQGCTWPR